MIRVLGRRTWMILGGAGVLMVIGVLGSAFGLHWLAVACIGLLQLAILGLLLVAGPAADSAARLDAVAVRLVAALEAHRLEADERHRELLDRFEQRQPSGD